jgi:hypothetical protein
MLHKYTPFERQGQSICLSPHIRGQFLKPYNHERNFCFEVNSERDFPIGCLSQPMFWQPQSRYLRELQLQGQFRALFANTLHSRRSS